MEGPAKLIKSTIEGFDIDPDVRILSQIKNKIGTIESIRLKRVAEQESALEEITNEYETRLTALRNMEMSGDRKVVLEEINLLNNLKFKLAKNYLDLENEINDLSQEYKKKMGELGELKNLNILSKEVSNNPDSNVLKLKIYKNLGLIIQTQLKMDEGIDPEAESSFVSKLNEDYNTDRVHNLIITNSRTNITTSLQIDEKNCKLSDYFITNYIWDNL